MHRVSYVKLFEGKSTYKVYAIIFILFVVPIFLLSYFTFQNTAEQAPYTLRCGKNELKDCSIGELRPGDKVSLLVNATSFMAKYKSSKPDLCYYTNIKPYDILKSELITINGAQFYGGCIRNAYSFYASQGSFVFAINGVTEDGSFSASVLLVPASSASIEEKITKEGTEIISIGG